MGIRRTLTALLTAPLAAVLESRIRELARRVLDEQDLASPADIRELAAKVDHARRGVDELATEIQQIRDAVAAVRLDTEDGADEELALRVAALSSQDAAITKVVDELRAEFDRLGTEVSALQTSLDTAARGAPRASVPDAEPAPVAAEAAPATDGKACKVPGCDGAHRARGFCGRHYQMWKRGTLLDFVGPEGEVGFSADDGARRFKLADTSLAGAPATVSRGKVRVDGKAVTATRLG